MSRKARKDMNEEEAADASTTGAALSIPAPSLWTPLGTALPASLAVTSPKTSHTRQEDGTPTTANTAAGMMNGTMSGFTQAPCLIKPQEKSNNNDTEKAAAAAAKGAAAKAGRSTSEDDSGTNSSRSSSELSVSEDSTSSASLVRPAACTTIVSELLYLGARVRLHPERCEEELYAIDRLGDGAVRAVRFIARHGLIGHVIRSGSTPGTLLVRFVLPPSLIAAPRRASQCNTSTTPNGAGKSNHTTAAATTTTANDAGKSHGKKRTASPAANSETESQGHAAYVPLSHNFAKPNNNTNNNNNDKSNASPHNSSSASATTTTNTAMREQDGSQSEGPLISFLSLTQSPKLGAQSRTLASSAAAAMTGHAFALLAGPHGLWSMTPHTLHAAHAPRRSGSLSELALLRLHRSEDELHTVGTNHDSTAAVSSRNGESGLSPAVHFTAMSKGGSLLSERKRRHGRRAHSWPLHASMAASLRLGLHSMSSVNTSSSTHTTTTTTTTATTTTGTAAASSRAALRQQWRLWQRRQHVVERKQPAAQLKHTEPQLPPHVHHHHLKTHKYADDEAADVDNNNNNNTITVTTNAAKRAQTFSVAFVVPSVCCVPLLCDVLAGGAGKGCASYDAIHAALETNQSRRALRLASEAARLLRAVRRHSAKEGDFNAMNSLTAAERQRVAREEDAVVGALRARLALTAGKLRRCVSYSLPCLSSSFSLVMNEEDGEVGTVQESEVCVAEYVVPLLTSLLLGHQWQLARRLARHVHVVCADLSLNFVRAARLVRMCEQYTHWQRLTSDDSVVVSLQVMPRVENVSDALAAARLLTTTTTNTCSSPSHTPLQNIPADMHRGLRALVEMIFTSVPLVPTAVLLRAVPLLFALTNTNNTTTTTTTTTTTNSSGSVLCSSQAMTRFFGAAPMRHVVRQLRFYATGPVKSEAVVFAEAIAMDAVLDVRLVECVPQDKAQGCTHAAEHYYCAHCHRTLTTAADSHASRADTSVRCEGCGAVYCSAACRLRAWRDYHALECSMSSGSGEEEEENEGQCETEGATQKACARRALRRMRTAFQRYYAAIARYTAENNSNNSNNGSTGVTSNLTAQRAGCVTLPRNAQAMHGIALHVLGRVVARLVCLVCMPWLEPLLSPHTTTTSTANNETNDEDARHEREEEMNALLHGIAAHTSMRGMTSDPHDLLCAEAMLHALRLPFFADTSYTAPATLHELLHTQPPAPNGTSNGGAEKAERPAPGESAPQTHTTAARSAAAKKDEEEVREEVGEEGWLSNAETRSWYAAHIVLGLLQSVAAVLREELAGFSWTYTSATTGTLRDLVAEMAQLAKTASSKNNNNNCDDAARNGVTGSGEEDARPSVSCPRLLSFLESNRFAQQLYDFCLCSFVPAQTHTGTVVGGGGNASRVAVSPPSPSPALDVVEQRLLVFLGPCASVVNDLCACATRLGAAFPLLHSRFLLEHVAQEPQWGLNSASNAGLRSAEDSFLSLNSGSAGTFTSQSSHTFGTATSANTNNNLKNVATGGAKELNSQGNVSPMTSGQFGPAAGTNGGATPRHRTTHSVSVLEAAGHNTPPAAATTNVTPNVRLRLHLRCEDDRNERRGFVMCGRVSAMALRPIVPGEVLCAEDMAEFAELHEM